MRAEEQAQVREVASRAFDTFDRMLFSTRGRETLVAVEGDERIVGAVVLHATAPGQLGPLGVVHFIFADPDVSIRGIGTLLRQAADARFDELGCVETSARIDVTNSASQALHQAGGYRPTTVTEQARRWSWRLPLRWWQAGTGFDPGMQLWLRPQPREADGAQVEAGPHRRWRALTVTILLNAALLGIVAARAPRTDADALAVGVTLAVTATLVLGTRELAIRLMARRAGRPLGHVTWSNAIGLAGALAASVAVWFPLTGSSTSQRPGWRHDQDLPILGRAHLAGALVVAAVAWSVVLLEPSDDWLAWGEVRRAVVMLALVDLTFGFSPMIGTAARHVRAWSPLAYGALVLLGLGPLAISLL